MFTCSALKDVQEKLCRLQEEHDKLQNVVGRNRDFLDALGARVDKLRGADGGCSPPCDVHTHAWETTPNGDLKIRRENRGSHDRYYVRCVTCEARWYCVF